MDAHKQDKDQPTNPEATSEPVAPTETTQPVAITGRAAVVRDLVHTLVAGERLVQEGPELDLLIRQVLDDPTPHRLREAEDLCPNLFREPAFLRALRTKLLELLFEQPMVGGRQYVVHDVVARVELLALDAYDEDAVATFTDDIYELYEQMMDPHMTNRHMLDDPEEPESPMYPGTINLKPLITLCDKLLSYRVNSLGRVAQANHLSGADHDAFTLANAIATDEPKIEAVASYQQRHQPARWISDYRRLHTSDVETFRELDGLTHELGTARLVELSQGNDEEGNKALTQLLMEHSEADVVRVLAQEVLATRTIGDIEHTHPGLAERVFRYLFNEYWHILGWHQPPGNVRFRLHELEGGMRGSCDMPNEASRDVVVTINPRTPFNQLGFVLGEEVAHAFREASVSHRGQTEKMTHEFFGLLGKKIFKRLKDERPALAIFNAAEDDGIETPERFNYLGHRGRTEEGRKELAKRKATWKKMRQEWRARATAGENDRYHPSSGRVNVRRALRELEGDEKAEAQRYYDALIHQRGYMYAARNVRTDDLDRIDLPALFSMPDREVRHRFFRPEANLDGLLLPATSDDTPANETSYQQGA